MESTSINLGSISVAVYYTNDYESGYERDNNGDGLPPSGNVEIESIEWNGTDVTQLLFEFSEDAFYRLNEMVSEKINR
jgi:hypothetical protein